MREQPFSRCFEARARCEACASGYGRRGSDRGLTSGVECDLALCGLLDTAARPVLSTRACVGASCFLWEIIGH